MCRCFIFVPHGIVTYQGSKQLWQIWKNMSGSTEDIPEATIKTVARCQKKRSPYVQVGELSALPSN